jgi:siderophore synthetase component
MTILIRYPHAQNVVIQAGQECDEKFYLKDRHDLNLVNGICANLEKRYKNAPLFLLEKIFLMRM